MFSRQWRIEYARHPGHAEGAGAKTPPVAQPPLHAACPSDLPAQSDIATSSSSSSFSSTKSKSPVRHRANMEEKIVIKTYHYKWPEMFNMWLLFMITSSCFLLGVFANLISLQNRFGFRIPWDLPYWTTVSGLALIWVLVMIVLLQRNLLFPRVVILGAGILVVLYMVGFVKTSITLWKSDVGVNAMCKRLVTSQRFSGDSLQTVAWLEASNVCSIWTAAWAFELVTIFFLLYAIFVAISVYGNEMERRDRHHHRRHHRH